MKKQAKRVTVGHRIERHSFNRVDYWGGRTWTKLKSAAMVFAKKKTADRRARKMQFCTAFEVKVKRVYRGDA